MSTKDFKPIVKALANDLKTIGEPAFPDLCNRLHNKAHYSWIVENLRTFIDSAPNYPEDSNEDDWYGGSIDDLPNAADYLKILSNCGMAHGILNLDSSKDKGYKKCLDSDVVSARYLEHISMLLAYLVGEWINAYLKSLNHRTLKSLLPMEDFHEFLYDWLKDEDTIENEIHYAQDNDNWAYPGFFLFIADYFKYQPGAMPGFVDDTVRPSFQILQRWSRVNYDKHAAGNEQAIDEHVKFYGKISTLTFVPPSTNGLIQPAPTFTVMKSFFEHDTGSAESSVSPSAGDYASAISSSLARLKDQENVINKFKSWIHTLADNYEALHFDKWNHAADRSFSQGKWSDINDYVSKSLGEDANFNTQPDLKLWICDPMTSRECGSHFLLGTQVQLADSRTCSIESIRTGDMVLSSVDPQIYGTVEEPCRQWQTARAVGFNGEVPFTTTSQVFMTASGLRAVDPRAALALNPWERVGRLAVGHCIYKLNNGSYKAIEIKSIDTFPQAEQMLYSVPLTGDVQYHHANGYLVACNDPVHSARSVTSQLRRVPANKRLSFLAGCSELSTMCREHGAQTVKDRLDREIADLHASPRRVPLGKGPVEPSSSGVPLNMIEGRFQLSEIEPSGYKLPDLDIIDGCIVADGQVIQRTAFHEDRRIFRWTREIPQGVYEHAILQVEPNGRLGSGVIYLSRDAEPTEISSKVAIYPFRAQAVSPIQESTQLDSDSSATFVRDRTFSLQFDKEVWPPDVPWDTVKDGLDGGEFVLGSVTINDYTMTTARIPLLDDLQQKINKDQDKNLEPLYRVTKMNLKDGNALYNVQIHRSAWMPFLTEGWSSNNNFNLEFKSELNIDWKLPCLYQELKIEIDDMFPEDSKGMLFEYNPTMRGMKGNRHYVATTRDKAEVEYFQNVRAKVSRAFALSSQHPLSTKTAEPSKITAPLKQYQELTIDNLIKHEEYNDQQAHSATQAVIQNMMLYHMVQEDREKFTELSKPSDLPAELADDLDGNLKTFLRDTYAPAWLCQTFASSKDYAKLFSTKQQNKLWYWWHGNGKNCLAQRKEYNDINKLATVEAVKKSYKTWITPYLQDDPEGWAQKMLDVLQTPVVLDYLLQNPIQPATGVRRNVINQQATIMHVLYPTSNLPDTWWQKIMTYSIQRGLESPVLKADQQEAGDILKYVMSTSIVKVISPDGTIPEDVQAELLNDVEQYEKEYGLDQSQPAEKRAANIVARESDMLNEASLWLSGAPPVDIDDAYNGSSLWQWINQITSNLSDKYESGRLLKGLVATAMVVYRIYQVSDILIGLVNNWDDMDDDQRAESIERLLQATTKGIDSTFDIWKAWKQRGEMNLTDQLDTIEMDQGTYKAIDEGAADLANMGDDINPDGLGPAIGEHVSGGGVPTESGIEEEWNKEPGDIPEGLNPTQEESANEFRIQGNVLKMLSAALGLGIAIAMTFDLVHNWDSMSTYGKVIGILTLVIQFLTVALDVADIAISTGAWAAGASLAAAIPIAGWVLLALGIIIAIISFFVHLFGGDAPPDPVEEWVKKTGLSVVDGFSELPEPLLDYKITPSSLTPGNTTQLTITGTNRSSAEVTLEKVSMSLYSGDSDICVFSDTAKFVLVDEDDPSSHDRDHVYVSPKSEVSASLPFRISLQNDTHTYYQYDLHVGGTPQENQSMLQKLVLAPAAAFSAVWTATVSSQGKKVDVDVVESMKDDMSHALLSVSFN